MAADKPIPVEFSPTADFAEISIVHGIVSEAGGKFVVKLAHPYEDFAPVAGWFVRTRSFEGTVTEPRDGQLVHCSR